jgi:hypothetical protein
MVEHAEPTRATQLSISVYLPELFADFDIFQASADQQVAKSRDTQQI